MIPKIIHYCWFGGKALPESAQKCMESWKKYLPDYEIHEWNEENFNVNGTVYTKEAFEAGKWAFITDYVRLYALDTIGGIYMDTDVEVLKNLDSFLEEKGFSGFERDDAVPTGIMAAEKGHPFIQELLREYDDLHFLKSDGTLDITTNVDRITKTAKEYGLKLNNEKQTVEGFTFFPKEYFCPKDYVTGRIKMTANIYTIHHFDGSWQPEERKYQGGTRAKLCGIMPLTAARIIAKVMAVVKYRGVRALFMETLRRINKSGSGDDEKLY